MARVAGFLLLVVPFIPIESIFGSLRDTALSYASPSEWMLGLFVFGSIGVLLSRLAPGLAGVIVSSVARADAGLGGRRFAIVFLGALGLLLVVTSAVAFHHRPLLVDSVVQLFQAKIFAGGAVAAPAPPGEAFVATQHMLVHEGRWFAQYPPGHAAVLALGVLAGAPWIIPVLLSVGTAAMMYLFASRAWDDNTGRATLALLLFAPFFWLMGASFMNHVTCLFFLSAFLLAFQRWEDGGAAGWALAAGLAIGAAGLARPLTAIAVAAVFAPIGLVHGIRRQRVASVALAAAGGLAAVVVYLAYNASTTGAALVPGYLELWGASHGVGFHTSPWGTSHTPWTGLRNELVDLSMLSGFLLEWPVPALLPAGIYAVFTGGRTNWDRRMLAGVLAIPCAYFFYWHRDAYLGPRFLYSGILFIIPLTARALLAIRDIPSSRLRIRESAIFLAALCFLYAASYAAPRRLLAYGSSFASMKVDLPAMASAAGIDRGVVFVAVSWGNRLLARMRQAGATASTAEKAYRRADHCEVEVLLRRAYAEGWSPTRVEASLAAMPRGGRALGESSPNGDPTLRLDPTGPLAPVCVEELEHDRPGYGNWLPFLLANDPDVDGPVLFLRDLRDLNGEILARRPDREPWLYRPGDLRPLAMNAVD